LLVFKYNKTNNIISDNQFVEAVRSGGNSKRHAVEQFFKTHQGMMYTLKSKLNLSSESIKDMYADAVSMVIWNVETNKFKGESKLSTYLYRIFYNKSVDHIRHISTNKNVGYLELKEEIGEAATESDERNLETKLDVEKIKNEILSLGNPCSAIIMEWAYWGYKMAEIAARNGLTDADKAKKKKYSCLKKLRGILQTKGIL